MNNKKKKIVIIITTFCFIGMIVSSIFIVRWKIHTNSNKQIYQRIEELIETVDNNQRIEEPIETVDNNQIIEESTLTDNNDYFDINFEELKKINPDTVGYIEIPSIDVNFVVVKGKNNSYYLTHNFNKEYNTAGWIFMDYKNKADGTDKNMVIYGHQMSDGSMFGSLSKLLDEEIVKDNLIINYVDERERKKYEIFSIYIIEPEEYYIKTNFSEQEFVKFKETIKERSLFKVEKELDNKNVLTLSTCQNFGKKRLAVHAIEI